MSGPADCSAVVAFLVPAIAVGVVSSRRLAKAAVAGSLPLQERKYSAIVGANSPDSHHHGLHACVAVGTADAGACATTPPRPPIDYSLAVTFSRPKNFAASTAEKQLYILASSTANPRRRELAEAKQSAALEGRAS